MSDATFLPDPSPRLAAAYRRVLDERMRGLPVLNPALEVEAVAFGAWEGRWLGTIVTPWFINLALAPLDPRAWHAIGRGEKRHYAFPAGAYEFIGASDPDVGELQICSLFSPVHEFADHATARLVATLAREALFDARLADEHDPHAAPPLSPPGPVARARESVDVPLSRRDVLRGRFLAKPDDDRR